MSIDWISLKRGLGSLYSQIERLKLKCKNTFLIHILPLAITYIHAIPYILLFVAGALNKLKFVCLKLRLARVFDFKWRRVQSCRWFSGTNSWVRAHVGDVIIVWRYTHNNTEPNAIWFPATLTDTDLNIRGIQVECRTNGNCNIPARERVHYGEQNDSNCLVPKFACCVAGPSEFFHNDFQLSVQELRLQARLNMLTERKAPYHWPIVSGIRRWPVDSPPKGQQCGKRFHVMTSLCVREHLQQCLLQEI